MDCKPSDPPKVFAVTRLAEVRDAIRDGNWSAVESRAASLAACQLPTALCDLEGYLAALKQTLIAARASRSVAVATLARVQAASTFTTGDSSPDYRQNLVDVASFRHPSETPL